MLLYLQTICLITAFLVGFFVTIPISINQGSYKGSCLLFADIDLSGKVVPSETSGKLWDFKPGSKSSCSFCIFSGSLSLIISVGLLVGTSYTLYRSRVYGVRNTVLSRTLWIEAWIQTVLAAVVALLLFITACLVTTGFHSFCEKAVKISHLNACHSVEPRIGSFYLLLSTSQISSWLACVLWLLIVGMAAVRAGKFRKGQSHAYKLDLDYERIAHSSAV